MHGRNIRYGHHGHGHAYNFENPSSGNRMEVDPAARAVCEMMIVEAVDSSSSIVIIDSL